MQHGNDRQDIRPARRTGARAKTTRVKRIEPSSALRTARLGQAVEYVPAAEAALMFGLDHGGIVRWKPAKARLRYHQQNKVS